MSTITEPRPAEAEQGDACPYCHGDGMATAYHHDYDGRSVLVVADKKGDLRTIPACVSAHCACPLGRWMRVRLEETNSRLVRRIPDLVAVLTGRSRWLASDPTIAAVVERPRPEAEGLVA